MIWADTASLVSRFCLSGPLLYIGLSMALDPGGFIRSLENLTHVLRTFEQHFQAFQRRGPQPEVQLWGVTVAMKTSFRYAGAGLSFLALLHLAGIVN